MKTNQYTLSLEGFSLLEGNPDVRLVSGIAAGMSSIASGVLRLLWEGHSRRSGRLPEWIVAATQVAIAEKRIGSSEVLLEAPLLTELIPTERKQLDLFKAKHIVLDTTALGLTIKAFNHATALPDALQEGSELLDYDLIHSIAKFKKFFGAGDQQVVLQNQQPDNRMVINRNALARASGMATIVPRPQNGTVVGILDTLSDSAQLARVMLSDGMLKVNIARLKVLGIDLGSLYARQVQVHGLINFDVAGRPVAMDAEAIGLSVGPASLLFNSMPLAMGADLKTIVRRELVKAPSNQLQRMLQIAREMDIPDSLESLLEEIRDKN